ncbi:urease accessory protein UreF [Methylolobus aquaticus]
MITDLALLRLLQLVSPGLPIGMYSYSQGLERAIDDGWVTNEEETGRWIGGILERCQSRVDLPIVARLHDAWACDDSDAVEHWTRTLIAHRETAELREEDRQTGQALARLSESLGLAESQVWSRKPEATLATLFAMAAVQWGVPKRETLMGYLWSWLENQVLCAVKLVPLGQVAGQRLLRDLADQLPARVDEALALTDDQIGGSVFAFALASSRHEMQYSRLFRS